MSGNHIAVSIFHLFVVVPLFLYVAFIRGQIVSWVYQAFLGLGIVILLYHTFKIIVKWKSHAPSVWVNIFHVLAVAPLMIYIGSQAYDTPRWAYEILAMFGFAALGYHIYSIIMEVQYMNDKELALRSKQTGGSFSI